MDQRQYQHLVGLLQRCSPDAILKSADRCDGHCILDPQAFLSVGLPAEVVAHLTRRHKSDLSDPKATLIVDGEAVKELSGVYGLELLQFLATALGVGFTRALGRGREACNIQAALHEHFQRGEKGGGECPPNS